MNKQKWFLYLSWLLSCITCLGSLFFSIVLKEDPCTLCWYQRICSFPLVLILGIAFYRGFIDIAIYVFPLVLSGFFIALYQCLLQQFPQFKSLDICTGLVSCSKKILLIGPITLPMLSTCFFFILGTLLYYSAENRDEEKDDDLFA